jgi:Holliday junction DNA helicase RuvA
MIGYLDGSILRIQGDRCWILVGGVGHIVTIGSRVAASINQGQGLALWIESMTHDGQEHLFGLQTPEEQTWFQWLVAISGVGGRMAINILSVLYPDGLAETIEKRDAIVLRTVDGVGPKLANRLITELQDKARQWAHSFERQSMQSMRDRHEDHSASSRIHGDAILALVALGYRRADAEAAVLKIAATTTNIDSVGQMITLCLPMLSST